MPPSIPDRRSDLRAPLVRKRPRSRSLGLTFAQRSDWLAHVLKACLQQHHLELRPLLSELIPEDGVVLDVGAHAGQFAKLFAKLAPKGRVYAFEPSPYALSVLEPAVAWNGIRNVEIVRAGLSDAPGALRLATPIKPHGGLGFGLAHLAHAAETRPHVAYDVPVTTIDGFARVRGFTRVDFVKMDIEGWEARALKGGLDLIARDRPPLLVEINAEHLARAGSKPEEIWEMLTPLGYCAASLPALTPARAYAGVGDYVWQARS